MHGACSERVLCLQSRRKPFAKARACLRLLEVLFLVTLIITGVFVLFITYYTFLFNFLIRLVVLLVHALFFSNEEAREAMDFMRHEMSQNPRSGPYRENSY